MELGVCHVLKPFDFLSLTVLACYMCSLFGSNCVCVCWVGGECVCWGVREIEGGNVDVGVGVSVKGWDEKVIIVPINVLYVSCIMCVTLYF